MQFKKAIVSLVALSLIALGAAGCGGSDKKAAAPDKGSTSKSWSFPTM